MGVASSIAEDAASRAVTEALDRAAGALADTGCEVEAVRPDVLADPGGRDVQQALAAEHAASELDRVAALLHLEIHEGDVEPATWWLAERGRAQAAAGRAAVRDRAERLATECLSWFRWPRPSGRRPHEAYDLLLLPTVGAAAPPIGEVDEAATTRFTFPFNLTGQPAISLPLRSRPRQLPTAVQLVAAPAAEETLRQAAHTIEAAIGPAVPGTSSAPSTTP